MDKIQAKDKANNFLDNLTTFGLGYLTDVLADKQAEIIEAVQDTGKMGTLTLSLKYMRDGKKQITVVPTVTPKIPVKPIEPATMFVTDNHKLLDQDPDNKPMSMEDVIDINSRDKKEANEA